jgi:ribonuclease III
VNDALTRLERRLGYSFQRRDLLERALTHRSFSASNYERLEFLGDSILGFAVSSELYHRYPALAEGELTRLRASLVRKPSLAGLARGVELGACLRLGEGELKSGGYDRDSILADALEAVFGAAYLDGGADAAVRVILALYETLLGRLDPGTIPKDPKTQLQEFLQHRALPTPEYQVLEVTGEPHQQRFVVSCRVASLAEPVRGEGDTRRAAEQEAAARVLQQLPTP